MTVDLVHELQENGARERRNAAAIRKAMPRVPKEKKAKRASPEMDAQKAVVAWLRKAGCIVSRNINELPSKERDPNKRARFWAVLKTTGCTPGFPDLTVILPDGQVCLVEMKAPKGVASDTQKAMLADLNSRGCIAVVGRDIWSVQQALTERGIVINHTGLRIAAPVSPLRAG